MSGVAGVPATPQEVKAWLGNYKIEAKAVQQLKQLDPYQQKAVISRGSLKDARDPTAVVISRCKKALQGEALSTTVLVRGMDFGTTDEQLENHMSSVGPVQQIRWITQGQSAEVSYNSVDEAVWASQNLHQSIIPGNTRYIDVLQQDVGQSNWPEASKGSKRSVAPGSVVFVRGFDFGTPYEQFEAHMSTVGTIVDVHLADKGSAEITYSNAMEAAAAIEQLNQTTIPGNTRYIDVMRKEDGPSSAKRQKSGGGDEETQMMMQMMQMMTKMLAAKMGGSSGAAPSKPSWPSSNSNLSPEKNALVTKVKNFQKSSQENRQTWYGFCDTQPLGKYDPAKYEPNVLRLFLASVGSL